MLQVVKLQGRLFLLGNIVFGEEVLFNRFNRGIQSLYSNGYELL